MYPIQRCTFTHKTGYKIIDYQQDAALMQGGDIVVYLVPRGKEQCDLLMRIGYKLKVMSLRVTGKFLAYLNAYQSNCNTLPNHSSLQQNLSFQKKRGGRRQKLLLSTNFCQLLLLVLSWRSLSCWVLVLAFLC
jgi:hypothetical protein